MSEDVADDHVARLVVTAADALSAATTTDELLGIYLRLAANALPSRFFGIYLLGPSPGSPVVSATEGVSDVFLTRYEHAGRSRDLVLARALSTGRAAHSAHLMSPDAWQGQDVYKDVLALHGMRMVLEAPVVAGSKVLGTLNFADRDAGLLARPGEIAVATALGRVVGSAVANLQAHRVLVRERDNALAALDVASVALVVTDLRTGRGVLNGAARALLREVAPDDPDLWEDIMAAARATGDPAPFTWRVDLGDRDVRLSLRSMPGPPGSETALAVLSAERGRAGATQLPLTVVAVLSPREQEVAALAVQGLKDQEIAAKVFLSLYTVKQHLKSAYRKLGVGSRGDLVRLALGSAPVPPSREG